MLVVGVRWPMETFIERLLIGLAATGFDLTIESNSSPDRAWLGHHGISWRFGPRSPNSSDVVSQWRRNGASAATATAAQAIRNQMRGTPPLPEAFDVIYAPWISALIGHESLRHTGVPLLTSCRGSQVTVAPWDPQRVGYRAALQASFTAATLVHCVSDAIVLDAVDLGLDPAKARVIRPAVDPEVFHPIERDRSGTATRVIAVGGLTWRKDYERALVALRRAIDLGAHLHLDLIGDGEDRQHLQYVIDDLELTDRVDLMGQLSTSQIRDQLQRSHIFLHTSCAEGISNAVLEAMATGLPVVTIGAGGMAEAVRDGLDGIVVDLRDTEAVATGLVRLAGNPEQRRTMGASARARAVASLSLQSQIRAFGALLREVAGR